MDIKAKVVRIPTEIAGPILYHTKFEEFHFRFIPDDEHRYIQYHLYFTTNEKIKEGDWFIDDAKQLRRSITSDPEYWAVRKDYLKVVATTNPELWTRYESKGEFSSMHNITEGIPKIGLDFIETFVREQGKIEDVLLKYYQLCIQTGMPCGMTCYSEDTCKNSLHIMLRSNGTVIIHYPETKEKTYTERDMYVAFTAGGMSRHPHTDFEGWIKKYR